MMRLYIILFFISKQMNELAAAELHELLTLIVEHINFLTERQLSTLVIDFVKNADNNYVLNEVIAFQFDQSECVTQSKYNVVRRPMLVKFQIESFFKCDLDSVSTDIEADADADAKDESNDEENDMDNRNMYTIISAALKAKALAVNEGDDIQTPNTVLCRMCNSRINSTCSRYHVTSTMIYSTVMHIRARIPSHDWPKFCGDNSYTLLSMQRNIKSVIGEGSSRGTTTEANLFLCASCYRLYQEETNLIQLEHQIGVLTKNQGLKPPNHEDSTASPQSPTPSPLSSPKHTPGASSRFSSPKKLSLSGAGTGTPSPARHSSSSARPSSAPSSAMGNRKSRSPPKKMSLFSSASLSSRPSINSLPNSTASERFRNRHGSSVSASSASKRASVIARNEKKEEIRRGTMYQLAKPKEITESYTTSFLDKKKTPNELLSDSDIRDKFRDKNKPINHSHSFFMDKNENKAAAKTQTNANTKTNTDNATGSKSKTLNRSSSQISTSGQSEARKSSFPKSSDPPVGHAISRTDIPLNITVCRLAVNLHEVSCTTYII